LVLELPEIVKDLLQAHQNCLIMSITWSSQVNSFSKRTFSSCFKYQSRLVFWSKWLWHEKCAVPATTYMHLWAQQLLAYW